MASGKTARRSIPYPVKGDPDTVAPDMGEIAKAVDNDAETGNVKKHSELPTAKTRGRQWQVTEDTEAVNGIYWDTGAAWIPVGTEIKTEQIKSLAVTNEKIAAGAVTSEKIGAKAVTSEKLATGAAVANLAEHSLVQNLQSPGTPASGQVYGGAGQVAENTHKAITGLSIKTPPIVSGQVLVVWFSPSIDAHENVVSASLTLDGSEVGTVVQVSGSPDAAGSPTTVRRITGLTGEHTLAGNVWGSSGAGGTQAGGSSIYYEVRNS